MLSFRQMYISTSKILTIYLRGTSGDAARPSLAHAQRQAVTAEVFHAKDLKNKFGFLFSCGINQLANPAHTPVFSSHNVYAGSKS